MLNRIKSTADSLLNRRQGISPSVDRFLDEHGNEPITQSQSYFSINHWNFK
jgi:hypothetical protein